MSHHVYKKIELVGSSEVSVEDAIENAVKAAAKTLDHVDWFEVSEVRGAVLNGKITHYQVVTKVGFRIND